MDQGISRSRFRRYHLIATGVSVGAMLVAQGVYAQSIAAPDPTPNQTGVQADPPATTSRMTPGVQQGGSSTTPQTDASTQSVTGALPGGGTAQDDGGVGRQAASFEAQPGEIVVTGYRRSLEDSANAKKNATNFIDSIYAEDIGKFPDLNLAESLQRLPGVQLNRDSTGEGTTINVRGLSAGFTVTTLNGFNVTTSGQGVNEGRGSSLDILPSELFRRVTLSKSPTASTVEGGTAGVVDLQPVRAFDQKGFSVSVQGQGQYQDANGTTTPRGAVIVSDRWKTSIGEFGLLLGGAYAQRDYRSEIFNTVGYTTLNVNPFCPSTRTGCNTGNIATGGYGRGAGALLTTVPGNVPPELGLGAAGSPLSICGAGTPGGTSGLSCEDLSYAIVPRLVRAEQIVGNRTRKTGMVNFEYRPTEALRFRVDAIKSQSGNDFGQYDVMLAVRSYNNTIPIGFTLDKDKVLTDGTFGNAYFLNQSTDQQNSTSLFYRSLAADWDIADNLRFSVQVMKNSGRFKDSQLQYTMQSAAPRISPVVYPAGVLAPATQPASDLTPVNTGQYADYTYKPGDITPSISTNIDLPTFTNWSWNSIFLAENRQKLDQDAYRFDLVGGDVQTLQLSTGFMKQRFRRTIAGWQALDCASRGACTSTFASTEPSIQEVIPNSAIPQYLTELPSMQLFKGAPFNAGLNNGWLVPDFAKIRQAVNLDYFRYELNPGTQPANYLNTYSPRVLEEDTVAGYLMADGRVQLFGRDLRFNGGIRYTSNQQAVAGLVNDFILIGGAGTRSVPRFASKSSNWLPSLNLSYFLTDTLIVRGAGARTVTRANPADLSPRYELSLDADSYTIGNPALRPFYADNFDFGIEWYPRSRSVLTFNGWYKKIYDYPFVLPSQVPFSQLGIDLTRLSDRQRTGLANLGGGNTANAAINVLQRLNSDTVINLFGQEFQWIQPLDFLVKGVGFNANLTHIKQWLSGAAVPAGFNPNALLSGLAPWTYNGTLYYETKDFQIRLSYTHRDANISNVCPCNNIPGDLYTTATDYMDAQISFPLPWYKRLQFTIQAQNLLKQVQYSQYENRESQPDGATYAGRNFVVGLRANF
jgi:TonB-dependent receptor